MSRERGVTIFRNNPASGQTPPMDNEELSRVIEREQSPENPKETKTEAAEENISEQASKVQAERPTVEALAAKDPERRPEKSAEEKKVENRARLKVEMVLTDEELQGISDKELYPGYLSWARKARKVLTPEEYFKDIGGGTLNQRIKRLKDAVKERDKKGEITTAAKSKVLIDRQTLLDQAKSLGLDITELDKLKEDRVVSAKIYEHCYELIGNLSEEDRAKALADQNLLATVRQRFNLAGLLNLNAKGSELKGVPLGDLRERIKVQSGGKLNDQHLDEIASHEQPRERLIQLMDASKPKETPKPAAPKSEKPAEDKPAESKKEKTEIKPEKNKDEERGDEPYSHPKFDPELRKLSTRDDYDRFAAKYPKRAAAYEFFIKSLRVSLNMQRMKEAVGVREKDILPELRETEKLLGDKNIVLIYPPVSSVGQNLELARNFLDKISQLNLNTEVIRYVALRDKSLIRPDGVISVRPDASVEELSKLLGLETAVGHTEAVPVPENSPTEAPKPESSEVVIEKPAEEVMPPMPEAKPLTETPEETVEQKPEEGPAEEKPAEVQALEAEVEAARSKLAEAEAALHRGKGSKEERKTVVEEARTEYKEAVAKLVGNSAETFLAERIMLTAQRLEKFKEAKTGKISKKLEQGYDWYKGLSRLNLQAGLERLGVRIEGKKGLALRAINVRTVTSFGLLGVGIYSSGGLVGVGAFAARRLLSGTGSSIGMYDIMNLSKEKLDKTYISHKRENKNASLLDIEKSLAILESSALLAGKSSADLNNNELYQNLLKDYQTAITSKEIVYENYLTEAVDRENKALEHFLKSEKMWKKVNAVASVAIGAVVASNGLFSKLSKVGAPGSGSVAREIAIGGKAGDAVEPVASSAEHVQNATETLVDPSFGHEAVPSHVPGSVSEIPDASGPKGTSVAEILHSGKPTGATVEVSEGGSIVHAGRRGIEGAMQDLKSTDPDRYAKMIAKLHETYPETKGADSNLIHKFISEHQPEGKNFDAIAKGEIEIKADGSLNLDSSKFEFLKNAAEHQPAEQIDQVGTMTVKADHLDAHTLHSRDLVSPEALTERPPLPSHDLFFNSMPRTAEEARELLAYKIEKVSEGLRLVLGEKFDSFMKGELHLKAGKLEDIKNLMYKEFQSSNRISPKFSKTFGTLAKFLEAHKDLKPDDKIQKILLDLARQWKYK